MDIRLRNLFNNAIVILLVVLVYSINKVTFRISDTFMKILETLEYGRNFFFKEFMS